MSKLYKTDCCNFKFIGENHSPYIVVDNTVKCRNCHLTMSVLASDKKQLEKTLSEKESEVQELKTYLKRLFGFFKEQEDGYFSHNNRCESFLKTYHTDSETLCTCGASSWKLEKETFIDDLNNYLTGELK